MNHVSVSTPSRMRWRCWLVQQSRMAPALDASPASSSATMLGVRPAHALVATGQVPKSRPVSIDSPATTTSTPSATATTPNRSRLVRLPLLHERRRHDPSGQPGRPYVDGDGLLVLDGGRQ